jgi:hypothetical protein
MPDALDLPASLDRRSNSERAIEAMRGEVVDNDAIEIGQLYERSNSSLGDAVLARLECGTRLAEKKAKIGHGNWIPWLKANAGVLGFDSERTAQMLMKAATNTKSTSHLDEPGMVRLSRQMWGNVRAKARPTQAKRNNQLSNDESSHEEYEEPGIEDEIDSEDPENYRTAFLMRADQAIRFAVYSGPITQDLIAAAHQVVRAWSTLAQKMEKSNEQTANQTVPAPRLQVQGVGRRG